MNQAIYDEAIESGCKPRMAEMLACRKAPSLDTDKAFFNSCPMMGDELPDTYMKNVIADARTAGYSPSQGDSYIPGLADFRGDPKGFVSRATGAKAKFKAHVDECNRQPESDPLAPENCPMREDIVQDFVRDRVAEDPGLLERRAIQDVREEVISTHGPRK